MNHTRPAAVAGYFYPGNAGQLHDLVTTLLEENPGQGKVPKALIVPHAGLIYSGPIAARAFNVLKQALKSGAPWRRAMILGPNHRVPLRGVAAPDASRFALPGGSMVVDTYGLQQLESNFDVQVRADVHAHEHCLEVQLPFLHALAPSLRLLPLVVGQESARHVADIIRWAWQQGDILVVISSDLSHYHSYDQAQVLDLQTDELIRARRPELHSEQACGCYALNGLLMAAEEQGYQVERLDLRNSGDTAGSRDQVVGYGSYIVY